MRWKQITEAADPYVSGDSLADTYELAASVCHRVPILGGLESIPPLDQWTDVEESPAWFSHYHFADDPNGFELPFDPNDYVFSPEITIPVLKGMTMPGHFRRGVKKYANMIAKGKKIPPVTILWDGSWRLYDGNHRYEAHLAAGAKTINVILGIPKR